MINTMDISAKGVELIRVFESFRSNPYLCPAGKETVGYGHVIRISDEFTYPMDEHTAELVLREDCKIAENAINISVASDIVLEQYQFDALVCYVFNIGVSAFKNESTVLTMVNEGRHIDALDWFRKWNKITVGGVKKVSFGLVVRRELEVQMYSGELENAIMEDLGLIKDKTRQEMMKGKDNE